MFRVSSMTPHQICGYHQVIGHRFQPSHCRMCSTLQLSNWRKWLRHTKRTEVYIQVHGVFTVNKFRAVGRVCAWRDYPTGNVGMCLGTAEPRSQCVVYGSQLAGSDEVYEDELPDKSWNQYRHHHLWFWSTLFPENVVSEFPHRFSFSVCFRIKNSADKSMASSCGSTGQINFGTPRTTLLEIYGGVLVPWSPSWSDTTAIADYATLMMMMRKWRGLGALLSPHQQYISTERNNQVHE